MLGYEIRSATFDGIAGEQTSADVYRGKTYLKSFYFPCAVLQARIWVLLRFLGWK
jgi:hypothetical protein